MLPSSIKNKIDCYFADDMYSVYQQNRYGINGCKKIDNPHINRLNDLRKTFDFYNTWLFKNDCEINPAYNQPVFGGCNVNLLIETISLL